VAKPFYADADNDDYGNAAVTTLACTAPSGYVVLMIAMITIQPFIREQQKRVILSMMIAMDWSMKMY
jgi:hypothetical protein